MGKGGIEQFTSIVEPLSSDLREVGDRIAEVLPSAYSFLTEAANYATASGGKYLRPLVILTTYRALGFQSTTKVQSLAASFQLIHTASLVHDDVIDHAALRRGRPSIHKAFGEPVAIVTGDYLFVRAFQLAADYGSAVIKKCGEASADLALGEVMQENSRFDMTVNKERYLRIIAHKTANAIAAGAESAAMVAGVDEEIVHSLADYGRSMGIAFQIKDDILDVFGDPEVTGKPLLADFREGLPTLPSILAYDLLPAKEKEEFEELFIVRNKRQAHLLRLRELCDAAGVRELVEDEAERWSQAAVSALQHIRPGPYRDLLEKIAEGAVRRRF
ncbi:MAG: polyprenyl synthetase family protein [Candidatus Thermoplasmatota archaeon]|nr:polyprenyl synthetase family protein [Candidatus Thermoplasmatota archaeon]